MITIKNITKLRKRGRPKAVKEADKIAGKRLRALRKKFCLSQTQLGNHLGITSQQISKYELGKSSLSLSRLQEVCNTFNVNINYLLKD